MISHITVGASDLERAGVFYDRVFAPLGIARVHEGAGALAYGRGEDRTCFWVVSPFDGRAPAPGNGWHAAFLAPDRAAVHAFHAAALAAGGSDEGAPGPRPQYTETYYAAYVRDPDGNKLQAVCYRAE